MTQLGVGVDATLQLVDVPLLARREHVLAPLQVIERHLETDVRHHREEM